MRSLVAALAVAAPAILSLGDAQAAVRLCRGEVTSGLVAGETELAARKGALDGWKGKALSFGEAYTNWRLADRKFLECLPAKSGGYECIARGAPCTIEQAPSRRHLRDERLGI